VSNYTVMIPSATPGAAVSSPPYATLEDALGGAKFSLRNDAASAWIVDRQGDLVLRAEQVKSRLGSLDEWDCSSVQPTGVVNLRLQAACIL
jgi:hypothetical protein